MLVAPLQHVSLKPWAREVAHYGEDWIALRVNLRGLTILYIQVYLLTGVGVAGNQARLKAISAFILSEKLLFVAVGDWNNTPSELAASPFLAKIGAVALTVGDQTPTCRSGRCLDFLVVSAPLAPCVTGMHFVNAPWKTHDAVGFDINRRPF